MKTGIVFEIKEGKATILGTNGEFISIPAQQGWRIGDVIPVKEKIPIKKLIAIAACFIFLICSGGIGTFLYFDETTLISMDINPSLEFGLNRFERVVSATALNDDGWALVEKVPVRNKSYADALEVILTDTAVKDFISNTDNITMTVYSSNGEKESLILEKMKLTTNQILQDQNMNADVEMYSVNNQVVEEAHMHGVTAGKYIYLEQLQEISPDININEYTHCSINNIKEQISLCQANHMPSSLSDEIQEEPVPQTNQRTCHRHGHH